MSRLTCKTAIGYCDMADAVRENKLEKLGQLEDLMERYGIEEVEQLENTLELLDRLYKLHLENLPAIKKQAYYDGELIDVYWDSTRGFWYKLTLRGTDSDKYETRDYLDSKKLLFKE